MELTEIRIDIPKSQHRHDDNRSNLMACFSLVFDRELVVHSIKLIRGHHSPFLAMPAEKKCDHCKECKCKNHYLANYCNNCGVRLEQNRHLSLSVNSKGQLRLFHDILHPLTPDLREYLYEECLEAYEEEMAKPGSYPSLSTGETKRAS